MDTGSSNVCTFSNSEMTTVEYIFIVPELAMIHNRSRCFNWPSVSRNDSVMLKFGCSSL